MARAIVKITLEVQLSDAWGNDWTLGNMFKSARDAATNLIYARMKNHDTFKIVGVPEVTTIITEDK